MRPFPLPALVLSGLLLLASGASSQLTSSATLVNDPTGAAAAPAVATNGAVLLVTFFADGHLLATRSFDGGATWSTPVPVDGDPAAGTTKLGGVRSGRSTLWMSGPRAFQVWEDDRAGETDLYFARSEDAGASWQQEIRLDDAYPPGRTGGIAEFAVAVAPGPGAELVVVLLAVQPGGPLAGTFPDELYLVTSVDGGQSFGPAVPASSANAVGDVDALALAVSGPRVHVAFTDDRAPGTSLDDVWYRRGTVGGGWDFPEYRVDSSGPSSGDATSLCMDVSRGTIALGWGERFGTQNDEARVAVSADDGDSFALDVPVGDYAPGLDDVDSLCVRITSRGEIVAAWDDDRLDLAKTGGGEFDSVRSSFSVDFGATWAPDLQVGPAPGRDPRLVVGACGAALAWLGGGAGGGPDAVLSAVTTNGQVWTTPLPVSTNIGDADEPALTHDAAADAYRTVWLSDELDPGGADDVYAASFAGTCPTVTPNCFFAAGSGPGGTPGSGTVGSLKAPRSGAPARDDRTLDGSGGSTEAFGPSPFSQNLIGLDYTPLETKADGVRPIPAQRLSVFYPTGTPPMDGWPVLLYSPCGAFKEAQVATENTLPYPLGVEEVTYGETYPLTQICRSDEEAADPAVNGFFYEALLDGWAIVTVGTIGVDSKLQSDGRRKPFGIQLPPDRDPNVFYPYRDSSGMPTAEWEDFELFWGEKDFAWARQYVAEHETELGLNDDLVVATGVSCGSIYAASVALGPDRAHASGSSQVVQSTQCAGFIGFETPAWFPAFNEEVPAPHWEGPTPGLRAATIADADPDDLIASSVSTWIRESGSLAMATPAVLVYDEGVAPSGTTAYERKDSSGSCGTGTGNTGDPCLTDALLPCVDCGDLDPICAALSLPSGCFCIPASRYCEGSSTDIIDYTRAHDSWNGVILYQDLSNFGHANSHLFFETGVMTAYPGLPQVQDGIFSDTSGSLAPTAADDPLVQGYVLSWLCQLRDTVTGSTSSCPQAAYRNVAPNLPSLSVTPPVLGGTMGCVVDLATTGHPLARIVGLDTPATIALATYNLLCTDGGSGILFQLDAAGPLAIFGVPIPSGTFLVGQSFCIQGIHYGSTAPNALSNAQDVTVGL